MNGIIASIVIVTFAVLMTVQMVRLFRYHELADRKQRLMPLLAGICLMTVLCDLLAGGDVVSRMPWELMLCIVSMLLLVFSMCNHVKVLPFIYIMMAMETATAVLYVCSTLGWMRLPDPDIFIAGASVAGVVPLFIYCVGILKCIKDTKTFMNTCSIWNCICVALDAVYMTCILMSLLFLQMFSDGKSIAGTAAGHIFVMMSLLTVAAIGVRIICNSHFVFLQSRERGIAESVRMMNMVHPVTDVSKADDVYRDIYERVTSYFETDKPYLRGELSINDIVKVVYTNKVYISKAVSMFSGRNFCQFVNYYRITYCVELYRSRPDLKVHELAGLCGFNSHVTFHSAFRLLMGESPGDWCRKEKSRLKRKKN